MWPIEVDPVLPTHVLFLNCGDMRYLRIPVLLITEVQGKTGDLLQKEELSKCLTHLRGPP